MTGSAFAVAGLGFGDEGKGSIVDFLVRSTGASAVVRWNGGPQAAHHVVTASGTVHCFAQFGAGSFVEGTETILAREMLVDPLALAREEEVLRSVGVAEPFRRLTIDPLCRLVLPFHKLVNQMRELTRGERRHGSCGRGVGEAVWDSERLGSAAIVAGDLLDHRVLGRKLDFLWRMKLDLAQQLAEEHSNNVALEERLETFSRLDIPALASDLHAIASASGVRITSDQRAADLLETGRSIVLEGAHGVLLDRRTGFFPHVTNTDTTFGGAARLLGRPPIRIGVVRAYATRHGAGPFVTEEAALTKDLPDSHNQTNDWQGPIRAGWLDLVALRYAIRASGGVDFLAITNLDRLSGLPAVQAAIDYELPRGGGEFFGRNSSGRRRLRLPRETTTARQAALTEVLSDCRPVYREFPGWKEPLAEVRALSQLPRPARRFLDFLESENGLGIPVAVVSVGPTAEQKIVLEPFRQ